MMRQTIVFEWQISEDVFLRRGDFLVETLGMNPARWVTPGEMRLLIRLARWCSGLLIAIVAVAGVPFSPEHHAYLVAQAGVYQALGLEAQSWQTDNAELYGRVVDPSVKGHWLNEWRTAWKIAPDQRADYGVRVLKVDAQAHTARVQLQVDRPPLDWWRAASFREIRFYQETEQGWVRTAPPDGFWGASYSRETTHLVFEYYTPDAAAVETIVPQMESFYVALYTALGMTPPEVKDKLTFVVAPDIIRGWRSYGERLEFTSPQLAEVPAGLNHADYLALMLSSRLSYRAVTDALTAARSGGGEYRWNALTWGLRSWLRADLVGVRAPWQTKTDEALRAYLAQQRAIRLHEITEWNGEQRLAQEQMMRQFAAAESVIAYVVATHGRDHLPVFLKGLGKYNGWKELIGGLYGISVREFEEGWNHYLLKQYDLEKQ